MIVIVLYFQIKQDFVYYLKEQRTKNMNLMAKKQQAIYRGRTLQKEKFRPVCLPPNSTNVPHCQTCLSH
jgi:hypothetical protein